MPGTVIDQWLVRTAKNEIRGPITHAALLEQIQQGMILLEDEVCRADGYWFYLHEGDETRAQLGISPPHLKLTGEDVTQTDTDTETLMPQPNHPPKKKQRKSPPEVEIVGRELERVSYLRMLAFVGVVLTVFLIAGAVRILWTN